MSHPPDHHGPYCLRHVGGGVTAHTPDGFELELSVSVATKPGDQDVRTAVVQLFVLLEDDTEVLINVTPDQARLFSAITAHAANLADGVVP